MKRSRLLITLLLLGLGANAGTIAISDKSGNPVPDGMVIHLWGDINTGLLKFDFDARNVGSASNTSKMKKLEVYQVPSTVNIFCWDICYQQDSILVSWNSVTLAPNQTWVYGSTDYYPQGQLGTTIVKYTIFNVSNPSDSSWFEVHYHVTAVGMGESVSTSELQTRPNPSNGSFLVDLTGMGEADRVTLYDLSGREIHTVQFSVPVGENSVVLSDIPPGYYLVKVFESSNCRGIARHLVTR